MSNEVRTSMLIWEPYKSDAFNYLYVLGRVHARQVSVTSFPYRLDVLKFFYDGDSPPMMWVIATNNKWSLCSYWEHA